jgi:hypothetical protein
VSLHKSIKDNPGLQQQLPGQRNKLNKQVTCGALIAPFSCCGYQKRKQMVKEKYFFRAASPEITKTH